METETLVYVDFSGTPYFVGRLWSRMRKDRESATFEYDKEWLSNRLRFALEPALTLGPNSTQPQEHRKVQVQGCQQDRLRISLN